MSITNAAIKRSFVQRSRWPMLLATGILLIGALAAWQYYDTRYPSWKEEVRLSDGRIITIHQKHEYYKNYGTNQSWVEIDLPELGGKRVWHSYLMPQRVDVVNGRVYVFGLPRGDRQLMHYRYPKHFMVAFAWTGMQFERVPYLTVPAIAREEENVLRCVFFARLSKISIAMKDDQWCKPDGNLGKRLDPVAYSQAADRWAEIPRWSAENRSE